MSEKIPQFNLDELDDKNEKQDDFGGSKKEKDSVENNTDGGEQKTPEEIKEDIEKFKKDAERMIKSNRSLFESFCESVTPKLKFSEGVLMDFKTMTIHLDTDFFYKKGFSEQQMLWASYHELSHFRDLLSDPRKFLENFKHLREKAEEYGEKIRDIKNVPKKDFTEKEKKEGKIDPNDAIAYKTWHTFYNCLDDVYVNSLVESGAPFVFDKKHGRHKDKIDSLYRDVLFKGTDYSKLPKSRQFSYAFLRKAMLPDEDLVLDSVVEEALNREVIFAGEKMKAIDFIKFIQNSSRKTVKAGDRYFMIRQKLEPIFEELYQKDLDDWQKNREENEKQQEGEDGEGGQDNEKQSDENGDSQNGESQQEQDSSEADESESGESGESGTLEENLDNEFEPENSGQDQQSKPEPTLPDFPIDPSKLDPEDIDQIIKDIEDFEKGEQKPDLDKEAKERQERQIEKWCSENNVTREVLNDYEKVKEEIKPYLNYLSKVWDSIIYGSGTNIEKSTRNSSEGNVNIERVIKYYADILSGQAKEVRPMDKKSLKEMPASRPEVIKVRFVGDASVSMDSEKQEVLKKVYVLIMSSLREFETKLNRTRNKTKSKLTVQTEGWLFGDSAVKVKEVRKGRDYNSEFVDIVKQFQGLSQNLGMTYDNTVYEKINDELTTKDKANIKNKKTMDIVFEVTDGGSTDSESTREVVDELEKDGLVIRSFQIGQTSSSDDYAFNSVWNEGKSEPRGYKVGTDLDKLVPSIAGALKRYIGNVKI